MGNVNERNKTYLYNCPLRGQITTSSYEERIRIECLNYLINIVKIPRENIKTEKVLQIYGSAQTNNLKADIVVFKDSVNEELEDILYVVENKVNPKDKDKAIKYQLKPAIFLCPNLVYGIYWDEINRILIDKEGNEYGLSELSYKKQSGQKNIDQLQRVKNTQILWNQLEQCLRNYQGGTKNKHRELLKILITKYYDESFSDDSLVFNTADKDIHRRIKSLYTNAYEHYGGGGRTKCVKRSIR